MAFKMMCLFLLGMLHAEHATADSIGAMKIGKAMSKFMPVGHMPRPVAQDIAATPQSDISVQRAMLKTLADMEVRTQEMQVEYQSLRARIQKMPRVDDQASFGSAASFSWLAGCYAFVGLATSVGVAAVKKFSGRGQHGSDSQLSLAPQCAAPSVPPVPPAMPITSRTSTIRMQQQAQLAAGIVGLIANPLLLWSLFTIMTTGCPLPAGPSGLLSAAESASYVVVIGFFPAELIYKLFSGSGVPEGPFRLLGIARSLSFFSLAVLVVVNIYSSLLYGGLGGACRETAGLR